MKDESKDHVISTLRESLEEAYDILANRGDRIEINPDRADDWAEHTKDVLERTKGGDVIPA